MSKLRDGMDDLSKRERQIMSVVYRLGEATAVDVQRELPDAPSTTSVRTLMTILEEKGKLKHQVDGVKYVYSPTTSAEAAAQSALSGLLATFFNGSAERLVATMISSDESKLTASELERLSRLIEQAKLEGK